MVACGARTGGGGQVLCAMWALLLHEGPWPPEGRRGDGVLPCGAALPSMLMQHVVTAGYDVRRKRPAYRIIWQALDHN